MSKAALAKVLSALEILVLEYQDDQSFQVIGHLPSWYRSLMGANQEPSAVIYLADAFPFLTYFLDDALQFWQTEQEQVLKSGLWVEVDQSGTEIPLEASALGLDDQRIILIALSQTTYTEKSVLIQQGRENALAQSAERKRAAEQLRHSIFYDWLTELPNQSFIRLRLVDALSQTKTGPDGSFALLYIDIKHFKAINTRLGLWAGDQLLMMVAQRLSELLRPDDIAARFGGDDFVVLLRPVDGEQETRKITEKIQRHLLVPYAIHSQDIHIQFDMGIAMGSSLYQQPEDLIRDACTALEYAKSHGAENYAIFHQTMHLQSLTRMQLEHDLSRAVWQNELRVCYQPIISLADGSLQAFEALVRWQHPTLGLLSPDQFIAIAEDSGLIIPIGAWILREACEQIHKWRNQTHLPLSMHVNLSARQLDQLDLLDSIRGILAETQLDPRGLKLEITETMVFNNLEYAAAMLRQIKGLGIQLSMDDFGTGYASLSYLHQLPVDNLKIDRSFVETIDTSGTESEIIQAVIQLAHSLNIDVVAEGVETVEQANRLKNLGCEYAQGYLFAKPMEPGQIEKVLHKNFASLFDAVQV
ncbi:putative bifunctional diguanylate cyclase/phosphodiesterase [Acaryochloris marina]|uniref:Diguanylate cyclase/phosphodiesterase with EAL domain n=1 Tax=Acaryochloris marina (strain MBIC 11017) TaxID=329726 RepID=B0C4N3_ACAM1|nr:bifunctional diguanylate cyclase/phosphodiesterase [Acaryochloris marina]ABW29916.1 diguanylate cyclase/phosphodiesterase with EAL domain [Acaryochloris marina MBIC11017]